MARPSSKKVMRAAQTGGGRTNRGGQSWAYWAMLVVFSVAGTVGVFVSRDDYREKVIREQSGVAPIANKDHWHAAYGIYICDRFQPPITDQRDPEGIHTHGDGIIHVHPFLRRAAGKNAKLEKFADAVKMKITDTELKLPNGTTVREGKNKCNGKDGELQIKLKDQGNVRKTSLADLVFNTDRMVLTIAFVPEGADIPPPPSEPNLDNLTDVGPTTTLPTGAPAAGDTSTTAPAPASSDTTSAPPTTTG